MNKIHIDVSALFLFFFFFFYNYLSRIGGTKVTTIIRKTTGDLNMLVKELEIYLRQNHPTSKTPEIQIRTGGSVVVNGNYSREIRRWLAGLGF